MSRGIVFATAAMATGWYVPVAAQTQTAQTAAVPAPTQDTGEIIVTAQRRAERLQDVPASITALSADKLAKSGILNTSDIARVTPGVTMPFYGAFLQPSIRGVTSTGANIGESPNVAMYVDGVYQPQQIATLIDLPDVQQIEILKGPQGSLYGQNATGGAILVNSLSPSFTLTGMGSLSYGDYNNVQVRGYVSGPITDSVAASIAGGYQDHDGFRHNVVTDKRDKGLDSKVLRVKILFEPGSAVKITTSGYYSDRQDSAAYASQPYLGNSVSYALVPDAPRATSPKQFAAYPGVFTRIKSFGGNIKGEFDAEAGTVNSITAYQHNKTSYLADADGGPVNYAFAGTQDLNGHYFTQELNFVSHKFGPVSFTVGAFYLNGAEAFNTNDFTLTTPNLPPASPSAPTFGQHSYGRVDKEVLAGYAEATLSVTDKIVLTGGGRYTHERVRAFSNYFFTGDNLLTVVERPGGPASFAKFSPRVTARYEVTPHSNVYASLSEGFKSGILNANDLAQAPVKPETITAYEVGYKGRVLESLDLNLAAFYYNYKNLQVVAYNPPEYIEQNAASAHIKGIEADSTWRVGRGFSLSGGLSYVDAKYTRFPDAAVFQPVADGNGNLIGNTEITTDLSGRRLLRAPKFSGTLSANYDYITSIGKLGAYVSGYYNSGYGLEPENRVYQGKYATLDAEISFAPDAIRGLRIAIWGKNLTDKAFIASALTSQFGDGVSYADPRTFGVRAEFRF